MWSLSLCIIFVAAICYGQTPPPAPLVIVPGLSASALENPDRILDHRVWVNLHDLEFDFYTEQLETYWDPTGPYHLKSSKPAVQPYDGLEGVCNIAGTTDDGWENFTEFQSLVTAVQTKGGAVKAVPYDWRLAPQLDVLTKFMGDMEAAIVSLYNEFDNDVNGGSNKPVIVAHSLGNLMTMYFLHQQGSAWVQKFVGGYVATSPPFLGAGLGLSAVLRGISEEEHFIIHFNKTFSPDFLGNFACFPWVFPRTFGTYYDDTVINFNGELYVPDNLTDFINSPYQFQNDVQKIFQRITDPFEYSIFTERPVGISPNQLYLVISNYTRTVAGAAYTGPSTGGGTWTNILETSQDVGDGTVPWESLHANDATWNLNPTNFFPIVGVSHSDIIKDPAFIAAIIEILETN